MKGKLIKSLVYVMGFAVIALPVYAAVFDSNLLPGSDNTFDFGTASARWRNVSLSGLLNLAQLTSDPAGGQNGSVYYNSSSSVFRAYQNGGWTTLGNGWWNATSTGIYYTGGVGVNAYPYSSTGLTVNGGVWLYDTNGGVNTVSSTGSYNLISRSSSGGVLIGSLLQANDFRFQSNGQVVVRIASDGKTSLGMNGSSTTYMLDVASNGANTARFGTAAADTLTIGNGAGKLNVGTVDPVYSISGQKYATYLPGMTGVREETTGAIQLTTNDPPSETDGKYYYIIDFSQLERGSDLWLFWQATDFGENWGNLTVLLTPDSSQRVWYKKDPENRRLTIYGEKAGEISYRLSATRFDWRAWSNTTTDEGGLSVPEK